MKNFIILIREEISRFTDLTEQEAQAEIKEYMDWVENLAETDNYISGDPLEAHGNYISKDQVVSDGPFIESKEAVTGYILIKANDLNQATELAKGCPVFKYGGVVELRPIMKH